MKKLLIFLALIGISISCHKTSIDPTIDEVKATVIGIVPPPLGVCSYAYRLQIGDYTYSTASIPKAYSEPGTRVWITYKPDENCTQQANSQHIISLLSIRGL